LLQAPEARPSPAAALVSLAQRLPSRLQLRAAGSSDRTYPSACVVNDTGGYYFRPGAASLEGEADLAAPGRARQLRTGFAQAWATAPGGPPSARSRQASKAGPTWPRRGARASCAPGSRRRGSVRGP